MNEATFEAQVNSEIKRIFPSLDPIRLTHQKTFVISLGNNSHEIDGRAFGRLDILVELDNRPLAILELKRPGRTIIPDDIRQGITYARLMFPMPPLVIISNGESVEFYDSYSEERWKPSNIDDVVVQGLFQAALECSAKQKDEAIRAFLGKRQDLLVQIIKEYTNTIISSRSGKLGQFAFPLTSDFSIHRKITKKIVEAFKKKEKLIAIVGAPMAGKTNVLCQLCSLDEIVPLYIDAIDSSFGIFQSLINDLNRSLFMAGDTDDIRNWIINGLRGIEKGYLVIIIDHLFENESMKIQNELKELIALTQKSDIYLVLAMDENYFEKLSTIPGRQTKTEFGRRVKRINLTPLDDDEFLSALEILGNQYSTTFYNGVQYNSEYRNPRFLRFMAAKISNETSTIKDGSCIKAASVTNLTFLTFAWEVLASDLTLRDDLKRFVKAYFKDKEKRELNPFLRAMNVGKGFVTIETGEKELGEVRISRLLSQGFVKIISDTNGNGLLIAKLPELFAAAAAQCLADVIVESHSDVETSYAYLIRESDQFPYGDLVGAKAILYIAKRNEIIASEIVKRLLIESPEFTAAKKGSKFLLASTEYPIEIDMKNYGDDYTIISNIQPWLILSHLASLGIADSGGNDIQKEAICEVGMFPGLLRRPDVIPLEEMQGFHFHDVEGKGSFLCMGAGIVEPISYAIQCVYSTMPIKMLEISEYALKNNAFPLAWRLFTVAKQMEDCSNIGIAHLARKVESMLEPIIEFTCKVNHQ